MCFVDVKNVVAETPSDSGVHVCFHSLAVSLFVAVGLGAWKDCKDINGEHVSSMPSTPSDFLEPWPSGGSRTLNFDVFDLSPSGLDGFPYA